MSEQIVYGNKNFENYSKDLLKLIVDISEEMNKGIQDGLTFKLGRVENDEVKLHNFVRNEGYDITYKEFTDFIVDAKDLITKNSDFIDSALAEKIEELSSEELSDDDLEQVSGGKMKWWNWLLIGVAAVAVAVACVVLAPVAIAAASAGLSFVAGSSVVLGAGLAGANFATASIAVGVAGAATIAGAGTAIATR